MEFVCFQMWYDSNIKANSLANCMFAQTVTHTENNLNNYDTQSYPRNKISKITFSVLSISLVKKESTNVLKVKIEILERAPLFNSTFCLAPNRAKGKSADLFKESGGQG